jgi:hypothetical protein
VGKARPRRQVPIAGLYQFNATGAAPARGAATRSGRLVVFGDSSCVDGTHLHVMRSKPCWWFLHDVVRYAVTAELPSWAQTEQRRTGRKLGFARTLTRGYYDGWVGELPKRLAPGSWVQPGSLAQHSLVLNGEAGATESCAAPPALLPQPPLAA